MLAKEHERTKEKYHDSRFDSGHLNPFYYLAKLTYAVKIKKRAYLALNNLTSFKLKSTVCNRRKKLLLQYNFHKKFR
jgi:hypothetical protein